MRVLIAGAILALVSTSAFAQQAADGVLDQSGRNIFQFRDANDRISRLAVLQEAEARRNGIYRNGGSGGAGGSGLADATAINNYFQVTNTVACNGSGASVVTCTGGTNTVRDTTQTTTGSTADASNVVTGNTVTNSVVTNKTAD